MTEALEAEALEALRQRLDSIGDRIFELLRQRTEVVAQVSRVKLAAELPVFVPPRGAVVGREIGVDAMQGQCST